MKTLKDIGDIKGKRVLVRVDFNVPIESGEVTDDFRIISALPTIEFLKRAGANICLIAHCEPNREEGECSLKPAFRVLNKKVDCVFAHDIAHAKILMDSNSIVLLENLRVNPGEKTNDESFAQELASLGDIFVNDAFSVCHREHASIVSVPKFLPSYAGFQIEKEVLELSKAFNPSHPFVFILGGAKFDTKLPLINKFLDKADYVCVGGALANDILVAQGKKVGKSLLSKKDIDLSGVIKSEKLLTVLDVVVAGSSGNCTKKFEDIAADDVIMDAGPETIKKWEEKIRSAAFVLWNGPLGNFEAGYDKGTLELAQAIASSDAESIVGGGDTLSSIKKLNLENSFSFISTGGGATLDFLADETLVGIEALR